MIKDFWSIDNGILMLMFKIKCYVLEKKYYDVG